MRTVLAALLAVSLAGPAFAQNTVDDGNVNANQPDTERLRADFDARFTDYDARMADFDRRLRAIEEREAEFAEGPIDANQPDSNMVGAPE